MLSIALTKYHRLDELFRIKVYSAHDSGGWEVQSQVAKTDEDLLTGEDPAESPGSTGQYVMRQSMLISLRGSLS